MSLLGRVLLLGPALVLALIVALPAASALAQSPEPSASATSSPSTTPDPLTPTPSPTATVQRWRLYLPRTIQPVKELLLAQEARLGGASMGIAVAGDIVLQAQGASLRNWLPDPAGDGWTTHGALDPLDPAPVDNAWLTAEGVVGTYLRQLREPVPGEPLRFTPFLRLSLLPLYRDRVPGLGANIDLSGSLAAQARSGGRLYLAVEDAEGTGHRLISLDVSRWEGPRLLDEQALTATADMLLALPETGQLLALASGANGTELWSWDLRGDTPRALPPAALPLNPNPAALLRVPEGVLAIDRAGAGVVIPLRSGRLRLDRTRAVAFPLDAVTGPHNRRFASVDAAAWAAEQVCLYHGIYISTHAATRMVNNLLACFSLPTGGPPALRNVVAADRLIDAADWTSGIHLAVLGDRLLLSRGSPSGFEVLGPLGAGATATARSFDSPPGRVEGVLRQGDRLITVEGDAQLRAWSFDEAVYGHLQPQGRLSLPSAGNLITRDLPPVAPSSELVIWRQGGLATSGLLQRIRLGSDPLFQALPAETVRDWSLGMRAAGNLLWSNQDGRIWRFGAAGHEPLILPDLHGSLQDVAHLGSLRLLAVGIDGILVLDGADQVIGRLALPGPATAIAVDALRTSSAVWVATGGLPAVSPEPRDSTALHCLDLSDPTAPRLVASIDLPGDRVDRLRAAGARPGNADGSTTGARVVGSGWQRRTADLFAYDVPLLFLVDARDCAHPRLEGATRWDGPPGFLGEPYAEPRLGWDLSPDGQRLFAARDGVEVYGLGGRP